MADNNQLMEQFFEYLRKNTDVTEKTTDALNDLEKAAKSVSKTTDTYAKEMNDLEKSSKEVTDANKKQSNEESKLTKATRELVAITHRFGSALLSSEQGTGKYGSAVTSVTDTVGNAVSRFGALGVVAGELIKVFGGIIALGLKNNDEMLKSYNALADVGVRFTDAQNSIGTFGNQILDLRNSLGGSNENMLLFQQTLKSISPDLGNFGGSVQKGGENFAKLIGNLFRQENFLDFQALGVSQEDVIKITGQLIQNQTKFGKITLSNSNTIEDVTKRTKEYIENLTELSQITGQSRDEAMQKLQEQQASLDFQIYQQRLRDSASTVEEGNKLAQKASDTFVLVQEQMGTRYAAGLASMLANGGMAVNEVVNQNQNVLLPLFNGFSQAMHSNKNSVLEMNDALHNSVAPALKQTISAYSSTAAISNELGNQLFYGVDSFKALNKITGSLTSESLKRAKLEEQARSNDPKVREAAKAQLQSMEAQKKANLAGAYTFENSMKFINKFTETLDLAAYGLAKFLKFVTFGRVDLTDLWVTFSDIKDARRAIATEMENSAVEQKDYANKLSRVNSLMDLKQKELEKAPKDNDEKSVTVRDKLNKELQEIIKLKQLIEKDHQIKLYKSNEIYNNARKYIAEFKAKNQAQEGIEKDTNKKDENAAITPKQVTILSSGAKYAPGLTAEQLANLNKIPLSEEGGSRTFEQQQEIYRKHPDLAALPGTSPHEFDKAIDVPEKYQTKEVLAMLKDLGFVKTMPKKEHWHFELINPPNFTNSKLSNLSTNFNTTTPMFNPVAKVADKPNNLPVDDVMKLIKDKNKETMQKTETEKTIYDPIMIDKMDQLLQLNRNTNDTLQRILVLSN